MDPQFSSDWFSNKIPAFERLLLECRSQRMNMLEIGSFEGRSACWFLNYVLLHPESTLTCIDHFTFAGSMEQRASIEGLIGTLPDTLALEERFLQNIATTGNAHKVTVLRGLAENILPTLDDASFDCIFIDGSHAAQHVLRDAILSWPLLRNGGLLLFDDYALHLFADIRDDPAQGIHAFLSVFGPDCETADTGYHCAVRKHLRTEQPLAPASV